MSIDARLKKLTPLLSAKERAILVLGSLKDGTPEDPSWRTTMPMDQVTEFNRLIGLMNAANVHLAMFIALLETSVAKVNLRMAWFVTLLLWEDHLGAIRRAAKKKLQPSVTKNPAAETVGDALQDVLCQTAADCWAQIRGGEIVLEEIAAEFDGADPLKPKNRESLEGCKRELFELQEHLAALGVDLALREPTENTLELLREAVQRGTRWAPRW